MGDGAEHTQIIVLVTHAIVGLAVLVWADNIVALFEDDTKPLVVGADRSELQSLAFGVVGILFLVPRFEDVISAAYALWKAPSSWSEADRLSVLWEQRGVMILRGIVRIAAGVLLVFGRSRMARAWSRMRGQPLDEDAADDEADDEDGGVETAEDEQDGDRR